MHYAGGARNEKQMRSFPRGVRRSRRYGMTNPPSIKRGTRAVISRILGGGCFSQVPHGFLLRGLVALIPALSLLVTSGCATSETGSAGTPRPGTGAKEYQKLVSDSEAAVNSALHCLDQVAMQTNGCPPKLVSRFSREVDQLQSESFRVRARAQAIQARGDAYFDSWTGPDVSADASKSNQSLAAIRESFQKLKLASRQTGDAFKPFLASLRKLRIQLEMDANTVGKSETRDLIQTTRDCGSRTVESLRGVGSELEVLTRLLMPPKA